MFCKGLEFDAHDYDDHREYTDMFIKLRLKCEYENRGNPCTY